MARQEFLSRVENWREHGLKCLKTKKGEHAKNFKICLYGEEKGRWLDMTPEKPPGVGRGGP